jgi:histidine ammonia-lyase
MEIDGKSLTLEKVHSAASLGEEVTLSAGQIPLIERSRRMVLEALEKGSPLYGINTGFGTLKDIAIPPEDIAQLQENLIISHAASVGPPLSEQCARALLLLRANSLARGASGVRPELIIFLADMLNRGVTPYIPSQGSVGASGDLALLAHMGLTVIGRGKAWYKGELMPAGDALQKAGLKPVQLQAKEGLALINGTQAMCSIGCLTVLQAEKTAVLADIIGASTLEAVKGSSAPFIPAAQNQRPHRGQLASARNLIKLTRESRNMASHIECRQIQDSYSLRCMPQVHGASRDAFAHARNVLEIEINSTTDNPLVLPDENVIANTGHFHGQPIALVMDYVSTAIAELGNISERRIERLVNPAYSNGLPAFLTPKPGLCSGYMIAQYTAASLVSENKSLAHPASVDSIPTSAGQEDHVSMGTTAARKAAQILSNVETVLAIELVCAVQALDFREFPAGPAVEAVRRCVRKALPFLEGERIVSDDINRSLAMLKDDSVLKAVEALIPDLE